jgi:hypothetical protein
MKIRKKLSSFSGLSKPPKNDLKDHLSSLKEGQDEILKLQETMLESPALNGGFTQLINKVNNIEKAQVESIETIDSIHEAIYHPDEGLYARVKIVEGETFEEISKIDADIKSIIKWKEKEEKDLEKQKALLHDQEKIILSQKLVIDDLVSFKAKTSSILKWMFVTFAGSIITLVFKLIYDFAISKF